MRVTSSRAYSRPAPVPKMPPGLVELMNGLAKEVLRHNPTNVYEFCANHMEKLIEIRDGPSLKKSMTLEQKIEKVQEKMRQKAKEDRDKIDKEMNASFSKQNAGQVDENIMLHEASSSNAAKALVHHEVDLQHASEVEISHVQGNLMEPTQESNPGESKKIEKNTDDSVMLPETSESPEIKLDFKPNQHKMDNKYEQNLDNLPIFEKVETENEPVKETELKDIAGINVGDSSLQTITESGEENLVNDNGTILPKITIGDGHEMRELKNISGESFTEIQTTNVGQAENVLSQPKEVKVQDEDSEVNAVPDNKTVDVSKDVSVSIASTENSASNALLNTENQNENSSSAVQEQQNNISDISEGTVPAPIGFKIANDSPIEQGIQEKSNDDINSYVDTNTAPDNNRINLEVPTTNILDDNNDVFKVDELNQKTIEDDKTAKIALNNVNTSEKEEITNTDTTVESNDGQVNKSETVGAESQSNFTDNTEVDAEAVENETKDIENLNHDSEKLQDNSELTYPKSKSNGNTNEDSMSMIESDLSKTVEDATQNHPNMDLETAAVTIQKVFRSFMFKSRNSTFEDNINDENNSVDEDNDKKEEYYAAANHSKERRTLGITRMESVLQTVNEEKSLSLSTDDSSTLSSAATTIQAHVRGFLVRNRLNSSKTYSMNSLVNSHEALESDPNQHKNKTILNIHIVPEESKFLSRDESLITSMDLSLDGSPPSSVNLHPMSCDIVSERRKMLKREDAVQSVSPPSNNSGKLSEDSVKEVLINENGVLPETEDKHLVMDDQYKELDNETSDVISSPSTLTPTTVITISKSEDPTRSPRDDTDDTLRRNVRSFTKLSSDESDVITPFVPSPRSAEDGSLMHSGEFHDVVLPTKVSRNDTPVVSEFKNVLVYFLLWNSS